MPSIKKIRNWSEYNKSLVKRGAIIFTFDEEYLQEMYFSGKQKRGGAREYSEKMYEFLLTIKVMLRFPWRATIGFAGGMLKRINADQARIPDYSHAAREAGKLDLKVKHAPVNLSPGMEIAFDSTGVNVYGTSGWHQKKYGKDNLYKKRDQWKKIHLALDLDTMQIVSAAYTESNVNDCEVVKELCDGIQGKVTSIRADGAYDTEELHRIIYDWGARAMIPAARTSKAQDELKHRAKIKKPHLEQRDNMIKEIRKHEDFDTGLKAWKISSGYHRRSLVEAAMYRLKRIFGFNLQQKNEAGRRNEVIAKINLLNLMASLGRAKYN